MSETYKQLMLALERDDDWSICQYVITHKPSNMSWWMSSDASYFNVYDGAKSNLGYFERRAAYKSAVRLVDRIIAKKLSGQRA